MRKILLVIINFISVFLIVVSLFALKYILNNDNIFDVLRTKDYIKSFDFKDKTNDNINNVFEYIRLINVFEKDGKLSENNEIAYSLERIEDEDVNISTVSEIVENAEETISSGNVWLLSRILDRANEFGIYLDENHNVQINSVKSNNQNPPHLYTFYNKRYLNSFSPAPSFNEQQNEIDFLKEVYTQLGNYYRLKNYFNNSNFKYIVRYYNENQNYIYSNNDYILDEMKSSNAFFYVNTVGNVMESNIDDLNTKNIFNFLIRNNPIQKGNAYFCLMIDTNFSVNDDYKTSYIGLGQYKNQVSIFATIFVVAVLGFVLSLILILFTLITGKKYKDITKKGYSVISFEGMILIIGVISFILVFAINKMLNDNLVSNIDFKNYYIYIYLSVIYCAVLTLILFIVYQCENSYLDSKEYRNSLVGGIMYGFKQLFVNMPVSAIFTSMIIPFTIMAVIIVGFLYYYIQYNNMLSLIISIMFFFIMILFFTYFYILNKAFNRSISQELKSSKLKVDLITNVSHDIRTPITSIINYCDILKSSVDNGNIDKEIVDNYTNIILEKSNKLNILLEDLLLASKASSGSIDFNMTDINLNQFMAQVISNFEGQLTERNLQIIESPLKENVIIKADGDQLFRIFQNLFSNIYKYAKENTDVHINMINNLTNVNIQITNVSKDKLDMHPDVLIERFTKADYSRNTEGFGLGLSIVSDLVKDMGGEFNIKFDNDVFISNITFLKKK